MLIKKYNEKEINEIVKRIENKPLTRSSHGFEKYGAIRIIEAAKKQSEELLNSDDDKNPAITLMGVVLAANRNYNKQVQPYITRMRKKYPELTFKDLQRILSEMNYEDFKDVWGHKDEKKYDTLKKLVETILTLGNSDLNDYTRMKNWAKESSLEHRKQDSLGSLKNIGIATYQHLRMSFGIDTVKPDQRVKEVLFKEFEARLSSEKTILAVEEIARITGYKVIEIDQIFVKYGSGYYPNKPVQLKII